MFLSCAAFLEEHWW